MNLTFTDARIQIDGGVWLCVKVNEPAVANRFVLEKKPRPYTCDIKEYRAKRSLDANAYAWILIDKIAEAVRVPKEEVYRQAIKSIGGVSDMVCAKDNAVDKLRQNWSHNGVGWQTDTMPSKIEGCTVVVLYYGSSVYDAAQMSALIDHLVQDAKALGIETMPPDKLEGLLNEWE